MNIVKLTKSHEPKQYAEEYTCFWKVFQIMRADIDRNNAKYQEICKRNVANGKLGGRPRKR